MLSFFDSEGRIPIVETYIFAGTDLMEDDRESSATTWYFKTPEGYSASGAELNSQNMQSFIRVGEDTLELVLSRQQLIEQLQES